MSNVGLLDKDGNTYRPDVFTRSESGVDVVTQAVANVNPTTGTPTDFATEATLSSLKTVADNLLVAANAIKDATEALDTGAIAGTVALDAPSLAALETITANTGGLTDAQLRAAALNVTVSNPTSNITGYATETTLAQVKTALDTIAGNTDTVEALQTAANATLTNLAAYNDSVEALLTALGGNTDGLEALLNTLGVQTDQVEPLLSAIEAKTPALEGGRIPVVLPAGGGGLTDSELRAEPVPVLDDHAGSLLHLILKTLLSPFG